MELMVRIGIMVILLTVIVYKFMDEFSEFTEIIKCTT